eukprot:1235293-Rhodomonas_salina.2
MEDSWAKSGKDGADGLKQRSLLFYRLDSQVVGALGFGRIVGLSCNALLSSLQISAVVIMYFPTTTLVAMVVPDLLGHGFGMPSRPATIDVTIAAFPRNLRQPMAGQLAVSPAYQCVVS